MSDPLRNRISLYKLEVFRLVVELNSVSRAADRLFVTQPVVTGHVRSLEQRLGVRLFDRKGHVLEPTEAGHAVYAWACDISAGGEQLQRQLSGLADGESGAVSIATGMSTGSYLLPAAIARFTRDHPDVEVTVDITEPDRVIAALEVGRCDFAVICTRATPTGHRVKQETIGEQALVLVAGPGLPDPGAPISCSALGDLPWISSPRGMIRRTLEDRQLRELGVEQRRVVAELGHPEAIKRIVRDGLGVALVFRCSVEEELAAGTLRSLEIEGQDLRIPVLLLQRDGAVFTPAQARLRDAVRTHVAATSRRPAASS